MRGIAAPQALSQAPGMDRAIEPARISQSSPGNGRKNKEYGYLSLVKYPDY